MKTAKLSTLTDISPGRIRVRGYDLAKLAAQRSFGDLVFLLSTGELPARQEGKLIEAMLIVCVDHGLNTPSTQVARLVATCGAPLQSAVSAGISALGDHHGGAGEALAHVLQSIVQADQQANVISLAERVIEVFRNAGQRVPGFGHRIHSRDPRAIRLLELADGWGMSGSYTAVTRQIECRLQEQVGRPLPMNVDGALAALVLDLGLHWRYARAIFVIARSAGLAAHVMEELEHGKPMEFTFPVPVRYTGPADRDLPSSEELTG